MRKTIYHILLLLAVPLTLLPIVLGAGDSLEAQRRESFRQMRKEHLHRLALDRRRRAERLMREEEKRGARLPAW